MSTNPRRGARRVARALSSSLHRSLLNALRHGIDSAAENSARTDDNRNSLATQLLDMKVLEDRTLYSATPLVLDGIEIEVAEDSPNTEVNLFDLFTLDDQGSDVRFEVLNASTDGLFASVEINPSGQLILDYAKDAFGSAVLQLQATNLSGAAEQLSVSVDVSSINDAPTIENLETATQTDLAEGRTVIDLFEVFDDAEDGAAGLTFSVTDFSNESLFSSVTMDETNGLLILEHAEGQTGSAQLTIVATDSGGLSIGMGTPDTLLVYDEAYTTDTYYMPDADEIGLDRLQLWTHWYFFELQENGDYDFSSLDVDKFTNYLEGFDAYDEQVVFDIENPVYENTPEGREKFAEVFHLANELNPDMEFGLYRFLPERSWRAPVFWARVQEHLELGIDSWYTRNAETFEQNYHDWIARNEIYRNEAVSEEFGGVPLADMVDTIQPSLYTFYEDVADTPVYREVQFDAATDTFTLDGPSLENEPIVRIAKTSGTYLTNGMSEWRDYYVVNVDGNQFQLAETAGGEALDFTDSYTDKLFIGAKGPTYNNMWHDPNVVSWIDYAEESIAEARKFDKPVYAWISPSVAGQSHEYLEADFFRMQLETLRPLVDSIAIYDTGLQTAEFNQTQGWWTALSDFMETTRAPAATFSVSIPAAAEQPVEVPTNEAPVVSWDGLATNEDQALVFAADRLLRNDSDANGDTLTAELVEGPQNGTLEDLGDGQWKYTPDADFHGVDSFQYRAFDGEAYSNLGTVHLFVTSVNDLPTAQDDQLTVQEDQPLVFAAADLLANDGDVESSELKVVIGDGPAHGTLLQRADGSFFYRANQNFHGTDQFTYYVNDGTDSSLSPATVELNVVSNNDRPVAVADRLVAVEDEVLRIERNDLLANDVDVDGDSLQLEVVEGPQNGQLKRLEDGSFEYVPDPDFHGTDQITYRVNDGELNSLTTVVEIEVAPRNDRPVASGDQFVLAEGHELRLEVDDLLANDTDADGDQLTIQLVDQPTHGEVHMTPSGAIVYTPKAGFEGMDQFGYRVSDGTGLSDVVAVQVDVLEQNTAPRARANVYRVGENQTLDVRGKGVLANDRDLDDDELFARLLRGPAHGKVTLRPDGSFVYQAEHGFSGTDRFRYEVRDEHGATSVAQAFIRVQANVEAPPQVPSLFGDRFVIVNRAAIPVTTVSQGDDSERKTFRFPAYTP